MKPKILTIHLITNSCSPPLKTFHCTPLQARDAVPQLLYLSRCDVQSVKLEARKALSSLGKFSIPSFFLLNLYLVEFEILHRGKIK